MCGQTRSVPGGPIGPTIALQLASRTMAAPTLEDVVALVEEAVVALVKEGGPPSMVAAEEGTLTGGMTTSDAGWNACNGAAV